MNRFKRTKGYFKGSLVQGTQGGGFSDGGAVGKNTQPNYGGFVGGMTRGYYDDGEVDDQSPDPNQQALLNLSGNQPQLSPDDFTKPGENIPQNAGIGDFVKYNLAHRNSTQDAMGAGMGMAGVEDIGQELPSVLDNLSPEASQAMQKALNDLKDKLRYNKPPPAPEAVAPEVDMPVNDLTGPARPDYSISNEKIKENLSRLGKKK